MKKTLFILFITFLAFNVKCEAQYRIPDGFEVYKDIGNKQIRIDKDFDGDGYKDTFIILNKKKAKNNKIIGCFLSAKPYNISFTYIPYDAPKYSFKLVKNVIYITTGTELNEYFNVFKFKYNKYLKDFELIGYDESINNNKENGYFKSVNCLTSKYDFKITEWENKITENFNLPLITMSSIDEIIIDNLHSIGLEYLN